MVDEPAGALQRHAGGEQPLDGQVVQVARDAVAVLEHGDLFRVLAALGQLHRHRGLGGEAAQRLDLLVREDVAAAGADQQQDAAHAVTGTDRHRDGGAESGEALRALEDTFVVADVPRGDGRGAGEGPAEQTALDRHDQAAVGLLVLSDGQLHGERVGAGHGHRHHGEGGAGDLAGPLGDQQQGRAAFTAGHQAVGDLGVGLQPALPQPGFLVEAGVVDGDPGGDREGRQDGLVLLVELLTAALLGQVQVAEDLVAHADRDAEEGVHRRVVRREAVGGGVIGEFGYPQRLGVADQLAEDAVALRVVADAGDLLVADADGVEGGQPRAVRADHPEGGVTGVHERRGGLHDAVQRLFEVEFPSDGEDRFEETVHPVAGAAGRVDAGLQFLQQFVQPELRQPWARVLVPIRGRVPPGVCHPCASCPRTPVPPGRRPPGRPSVTVQ